MANDCHVANSRANNGCFSTLSGGYFLTKKWRKCVRADDYESGGQEFEISSGAPNSAESTIPRDPLLPGHAGKNSLSHERWCSVAFGVRIRIRRERTST